MADTSQENGHGAIGAKELAAIIDSARRAAESAAESARATQQIANDLRSILELLRSSGALSAVGSGAPRSSEKLDPNLEIVIVAAVAAALQGRPFQVRTVRLADRPSLAWSQIGRSRIHASHTIEKRS